MKVRSLLKKTVTVILAAAAALIVLDIFCLVYFNRPSHAISASGATDFTWEHNSAYFDMTEGAAFNRTNNEGYFNPYDYEDGMEVDVLIMGASQMQGSSVQMKYSVPVVLSEKLSGSTVYNIGMAGHRFHTLSKNLHAALAKYQPQDYVVLEMETVQFTDETLNSILNGTVAEMDSYTGGLVNVIQRVDVFRLMYSQLSSYLEAHPVETAFAAESEAEPQAEAAEAADAVTLAQESGKTGTELLRETLAYLKGCADEYDTQLVIVFSPKCFFSEEGYLWFGMAKDAEIFQELCDEEGIIFVNMCPRYQSEFIADSTLPYGFANTSMGEGHLNKAGHAMVADEIFKAISEG